MLRAYPVLEIRSVRVSRVRRGESIGFSMYIHCPLSYCDGNEVEVYRKLRELYLDLEAPKRRKSVEKFLSMFSTLEDVAKFVAGIIDFDGCVDHTRSRVIVYIAVNSAEGLITRKVLELYNISYTLYREKGRTYLAIPYWSNEVLLTKVLKYMLNPDKKQQLRRMLISSHRVTDIRNVLLRIKYRNYRRKGFLEVPRIPEDKYETLEKIVELLRKYNIRYTICRGKDQTYNKLYYTIKISVRKYPENLLNLLKL